MAGSLIQCLPSLTRKESSDSLVNETSNLEQFEPPKTPYEKLSRERLKFPIMPPEEKKLIGDWTWTVNSSDIPTSSSNTINSFVQIEPIDSLTEPVISTNSDPLKQTLSCTTPSIEKEKENSLFVKTEARPKETVMKLEESVKSVEPKVPSWKPSVKSWFKSLANSLFAASKTVIRKSKCKIQNPKSKTQNPNSSDSEFELIPEKVTSYQKVEELDAPKVEESDVESCLPPPSYQDMKCEIITNFLAEHGKQKRPRSRSKRGQIQNSQQKQSCQSLPSNTSDRAEEQVAESPTRIPKDRVRSKVTGPVGRFKDSKGSDGGYKDEYSEDNNEFAKEINPSETNSSMKQLKKMKQKKKEKIITYSS